MANSKERTFVVTIDGPSASGKSSVSREIARRHGWKWVSTGAFYRGLAVVARIKNISFSDEAGLVALAESPEWEVRLGEERTLVLHQGKDVTGQVYREDVGADASIISQIPKVRQSLLEAQRRCADGVSGLVAEGRDCGTVVFPDAQLKIYLTAHSENRIQRRALEEGQTKDQLRDAQTKRDRQDSTRASAPLQIPRNAHVIDTSEMDLAAVIDLVDMKIKNWPT